MTTEIVFSLEHLPDDLSLLQEIKRQVDRKLGVSVTLNLNEEIAENLVIAKDLRNRLCGLSQPLETDYYTNDSGEREYDPPDIKESDKISSISTFTTMIANMVKLREVLYSQEANIRLQESIIEVLGAYDLDIKEQVVELFKKKVQELERRNG